jgi:steroid 5-alpha reductase family enzyme
MRAYGLLQTQKNRLIFILNNTFLQGKFIVFLDIPLFFLLIGAIFLFQWFAFIPAYIMQTEKFFDLIGSLTYVVIIVTAVFLSPEVDGRSILILVLILIWSIRLGVFLFRRIQRAGNDSRFDKIKPFFLRFLLTWSVQGLWITFTLSAALAAVTTNQRKELGILSMIGLIVWVFGFSIEAIADYQKIRFRNKIENRNKFIKSGLWARSRHPNYFGEIVLWIGVAIIAIPVLHSWLWLSLISPVFVAFLIVCISGVPLLEKASDEKWLGQKDYELYKEQTPILIPKLFFLQKNKPPLLSHLKGIITMCYIVTNLLIDSVPLLFLTALKFLFPFKTVQKRIYHLMTWLYSISTRVDDFFFWNFLGSEIEVQGEIKQSMHKTHLIQSNHRSWTDILILQSLFNRKTPVLKFLIKKELRFLPIVGWICWAYDYPFLERNLNKKTFGKKETKIYLAQELRKIKHSPATFVNFAEATRFTNLKREK